MTFRKMLSLLSVIRQRGHVDVTAGGELVFDFTSQPNEEIVRFMKARGFVAQPDDPKRYVYRPWGPVCIDSVAGGPRVLTRKKSTRI